MSIIILLLLPQLSKYVITKTGGRMPKIEKNLVLLNEYNIKSISGKNIGCFPGASPAEALKNVMNLGLEKVEPDLYLAHYAGSLGLVNKSCPRCTYNNHRISNQCDNCGEIFDLALF